MSVNAGLSLGAPYCRFHWRLISDEQAGEGIWRLCGGQLGCAFRHRCWWLTVSRALMLLITRRLAGGAILYACAAMMGWGAISCTLPSFQLMRYQRCFF